LGHRRQKKVTEANGDIWYFELHDQSRDLTGLPDAIGWPVDTRGKILKPEAGMRAQRGVAKTNDVVQVTVLRWWKNTDGVKLV
jgi:hypothetical protein